jgi:hypothetical protein
MRLQELKNILLGFMLVCLISEGISQGQCLGGGCAMTGANWGAVQSTTSATFVNSVAGTFSGEYNTYNVTNGMQYEWSLCVADGATSPNDAQLTLKTVGNVNICYSDDFCGVQPKIQWTATFNGQVRVLVTQFNCQSNTSSYTVRWRCVNCGPIPPGANCANPAVIASVPFAQNGQTTCGFGNNFSSSSACGSSYMNGDDFVYSYTPATNQCINVALTGTSTWTGVFVTNGCPTVGTCVAQNTNSAGNPSVNNVSLIAGNTYYIVISTWPLPQCTPFNINISVCAPQPPGANCANPAVIPSVPFTQNGQTTCGFGSNFSSSSACGSLYMNGDDFVYTYTPPVNQCISVSLTGTSTWTGVFVTQGCPTVGTCVAQNTNSAGNPSIPSVNLVGGVTYYIVISTWPSPQCTPFNINIGTCAAPPITASECANAINVCTNLNFSINPNGFGAINELCICCTSNPCTNPASANQGCLLAGELNSTWMIVNITTAGTLQFSFGAPGGSVCYDWAMWPYTPTTCNQIISNSIAPVRCNWNATCQGFTGISAPPPAGGAAGDFEPNLNVAANTQYVICFSNYSSATTTVPLNFFGTATVSCSALPIDMIDFYGRAFEAYNALNWATATEVFNSHFDIERSPDGHNFFKIGEQEGAGNSSSVNQYAFNDYQAVGTRNYYRLKQVDFNGGYKYSEIIIIENNYNGLFTVVGAYPNPTNDVFNIALQTEGETKLQVSIADLSGKIIQQEMVIVSAGSNRIEIPVNQMAKGLYMVSLTDERTKRTEKVKLAVH